jgi:hypothetical protein
MVEGMSGTSDREVKLDSRVTIYTRIGDVFAAGCFVVALAATSLSLYSGRGRGRGYLRVLNGSESSQAPSPHPSP